MNKEHDPKLSRARYMSVLVAVALVALLGQLANLTLREQAAYSAQANAQQTRTIPIFAPRGAIYDRNGEALATNRPSYNLVINYPYYNQPEVLARLANVLNIPLEEIQERVEEGKGVPYEPVTVAENLSIEQYTLILEQQTGLPGVEVRTEQVRYYPYRELAAQALGYVGEISDAELEALKDKKYQPGELIGKDGLEDYYEDYLRGQSGSYVIPVDTNSQPIGPAEVVEPVPGDNLILTIDVKLQQVTERALDWQMYRLQTIPNAGDGHAYPNAKAGAAVVMDVHTGAILAMASRPSYDPNLFVGGISQADWTKISENAYLPMLNRVIHSSYQPGSTWKLMTASASLATGVTTPDEKVYSGSVYEPTGQKDWISYGHGWVDMRNALRLSSDIYFYEMGSRLGIERLVEYAKKFGFGSPTGVDLHGEIGGTMPDEEYREANGWYLGDTTSAAIGQIFTVTPIQLVRYAAAFANGGNLMRPYLVQEIQSTDGKTIKKTEPEVTAALPITEEIRRVIVDGMKMVDSANGTSDFATYSLPGIQTAGKTGTAENPPYDDYGLYIGFAPADDPQIAVAVVIEQAGHGGSVSPVARTIYAEYFGVELSSSDPARVPDSFEPIQSPSDE